MAILKTTLGLFTAMTLTSAAASLVGCSSKDLDGPNGSTDEPAGTIGLSLQAGPGFVLHTVSYKITGPSGFVKTGTIDVSNSTKITALIGSLPPGKGFSITLSADAVGGVGSCTGSASFDIEARKTTPVTVKVTCHEAARSGSVLINGQLNVCPVIDGLSATPGEVGVGGNIVLGVSAHDIDNAPKPLSYSWKASSGSLSSDSVANPTFTCKSPGTVKLSVAVSDGDPTAGCADTGSLTVECSGDPCVGFDSMSAALGELTADCRGTVDPRDYVVNADGRMAPAFDSCPLNQALMRPIRQLLSLQNVKPELLPHARECIVGRFQTLAAKFAESGIDVCPTWSNKKPINPLDIDKFNALPWPKVGQLPEELPNPPQPPPGNPDLKEKSLYSVALPAGTDQQCGTPGACAAACAEAFIGFVIPHVIPPTSPDFAFTISVDPTSWWSERSFSSAATDPYLANTAAYHQMSYAAPTPPGEQFGALVRFQPCGENPKDPACVAENCSYWAGTHIRRPLQKYCNDYDDPDTCTSYCGPDL
jgi:hypothetical protein